nr:hypothetical protein [Tanacetum cinerariifolium]
MPKQSRVKGYFSTFHYDVKRLKDMLKDKTAINGSNFNSGIEYHIRVVFEREEIKNENLRAEIDKMSNESSGVQEKLLKEVANLKVIFKDVIQLCLWIVDSGCSKHMKGNLKLLINFVKKFIDSTETPSKEGLENLFRPMFDEYFKRSAIEAPSVSTAFDNSSENDTFLSTSLSVAVDSPLLIPSTSEEHSSSEPTNSVDVSNQEDNVAIDLNEFVNPFSTPVYEEAESSSNALDPSNMHTFYQQYHLENQWTKAHPLEQILKDPSKPVMTRSKLATDAQMCAFALTVCFMEPRNIKEAVDPNE